MRAFRFLPVLLLLAGCGHDSAPTAPAATSSASLQADRAVSPFVQSKLDNLWPNDDGHSWSFSYRYEEDLNAPITLHDTPAEVPAAPSPEDVLPTLRTSLVLDNVQLGVYGLRFDGQKTTLSGATGQNLVESLVEPGAQLGLAATPSIEQRLMNRVGYARPDLRGRIAALGVSSRRLDTFPVLLHGGAWEKTLDHIGVYGDLDRSLAWKFLGADTKQGATFHFQLLPSIATDVFLDAWVVPNRLDTSGNKGKTVEVVYVIDYGPTAVTDQTGATLGYARLIGYGSVTYVPGVGPVSMIEREIASADHPELPVAQITLTQGGGPTAIAIR
ncbi:MAG TPA: hypothetical protein VKF80_04590 [Candidatus Eisenbacteria bacterium]|nr:hypothetical protein [Candidatus Eisenbacteria bacterium]